MCVCVLVFVCVCVRMCVCVCLSVRGCGCGCEGVGVRGCGCGGVHGLRKQVCQAQASKAWLLSFCCRCLAADAATTPRLLQPPKTNTNQASKQINKQTNKQTSEPMWHPQQHPSPHQLQTLNPSQSRNPEIPLSETHRNPMLTETPTRQHF